MRSALLRSRVLAARGLRLRHAKFQLPAAPRGEVCYLFSTQPERSESESQKADEDTRPPTKEVRKPPKSLVKKESSAPMPSTTLTHVIGKWVGDFLWKLPGTVLRASFDATVWTLTVIWNPRKLRDVIVHSWQHIKEGAEHYWVGTKLLWRDIQTATVILRRMLRGSRLTRRERRQLLRTVTDIFRLVPLSFFIIVPFMEFLLPIALRFFPNMLPSTFQDNLKKEEEMRREMKSRIALAGFFADALAEMAKKKKKSDPDADEEDSLASECSKFVEKARYGAHFDADEITRIARLFRDELTLDNLPRSQLVSLCQYMNLRPYGSDAFLRWQLRTKLADIREDDQRILWEGVESLSREELREASAERGMRSHGLLRQGYERQLRNWLELSMQKSVPISLLIMSRAFALENQDQNATTLIGEAIGSLDDTVLNEVIIDAASEREANTSEIRQRKIDAILSQQKLIEKEREDQQREESLRLDPDVATAIEGKDARERAKPLADGQSPPVVPGAPKSAFGVQPSAVEAEIVDSQDLLPKPETPATEESVQPAEPVAEGVDVVLDVDGDAKEEVEIKLKPEDVEALAALTRKDALEQEKREVEALRSNLGRAEGEAPADSEDSAAESGSKEEIIEAGKGEALESQEIPPPSLDGPEEAERKRLGAADAASPVGGEAAREGEEHVASPTEAAEAAGGSEAPAQASAASQGKEGADVEGSAGEGREPEPATDAESEVVEEEEEEEEDDIVVSAMRARLNTMLGRLDARMEQVESSIGEKLHLLDKDSDGILSVEELKDVVQHVLKDYNTEEEASRIVAELDADGDGQVSVQSLYELTQRHKEMERDEEPAPSPEGSEAADKEGSTPQPSPDKEKGEK